MAPCMLLGLTGVGYRGRVVTLRFNRGPHLAGVGYRTCEKLTQLGVTTVRQLRALSKEQLQRQLGPKHGQVSALSPFGTVEERTASRQEMTTVFLW